MAAPALPETICLGRAFLGGKSQLVFKIYGRGSTPQDYKLVIEVTDIEHAFVGSCTLTELQEAVDKEGMQPSLDQLLEWLDVAFNLGEVEASLTGEGGLALHGQYEVFGARLLIRLPPKGALQPVHNNAAKRTWVAQDVMHTLLNKLRDCREQLDKGGHVGEVLGFIEGLPDCAAPDGPPSSSLATRREAAGAAAGTKGAPASGSAVKPTQPGRHSGAAAAPGASPAVAAGGDGPATRAAAAAASQPSQAVGSPQGSGGGASSSQHAAPSGVGKPVVKAGRGRHRPQGEGLRSNAAAAKRFAPLNK